MNKKGFTLLEVLITATIFAIMGLGIMFFISQSNTIMTKSVQQSFAHTNAVRILNMVSSDIRQGCIIKTSTGGANDKEFAIVYTDSSVVKWGYTSATIDGVEVERITRNGVKIPYIGDTGYASEKNLVYIDVTPDLEGKYMYANIRFNMNMDGETLSINTTAYCRHDLEGYGFNASDYINVTN